MDAKIHHFFETISKKIFSVRTKGLEPPRLSAPDPKSGTATNYATSACILFKRKRPFQIKSSPGKPASEGCQYQFVAFPEFVFPVVQTQRNGC